MGTWQGRLSAWGRAMLAGAADLDAYLEAVTEGQAKARSSSSTGAPVSRLASVDSV